MHEPFSVKPVSDQENYTFCFSCDGEDYIILGNGIGNRIITEGIFPKLNLPDFRQILRFSIFISVF